MVTVREHKHDHGHHGHGHQHHDSAPMWALAVALGITAIVFLAELAGGWLSGSMALLADAMHMLSDATGLIIALIAVLIGRRKVSAYATFGYRRVEVLAAALNAVTVVVISIGIVVGAVRRLGSGEEVHTATMITVAFVGLVANILSAAVLYSQRKHSINVEGAFLHVMVDLLGSVAVIVAGLVIAFTGFQAADVIASLLIAGMVLPRAWELLKTSISVLLERVPAHIDPAEVEAALLSIAHVEGIHDLHLWSMSGNNVLCTVHLITRGDQGVLLDRAQARLREFGIDHATIQLEGPEHSAHEVFCAPHEHAQ